MIDTTSLTMVADGGLPWLVDTAELALPQYYTLARTSATEAEITPTTLDAYSPVVGADVDDVEDVEDVTSRMRYLPATTSGAYVLRGAIRDAAIAAFAARTHAAAERAAAQDLSEASEA